MSNYITEVDICNEAKECFLTYAEEVLTDRAIPSAEDGLLSVHRKLLWTMEELLKLNNKAKYKKSASIVGSTLASAYFHGDAACYGALCKLAQSYLMRYPLVDGDGNFGSQEQNGMEAASRYTNARPSIYADLMFNNFKKDVVPLKATYNEEYMEPVVLPALFPNALVNGRESIGISMSHNSLPHNLSEICDGIIAYIKNNDITVDELMQHIPGPDFPLGGIITNIKDIKTAFKTGHSQTSLKIRGDHEIKDNKIIFTSIPYRTYRNKIREQITNNIDKLEKYIEDFQDLSNVGQNKLVFTIRQGIEGEKAVSELFSCTDLQTTISYNMNFIVNGTPKLCSLIDLIQSYVQHQHRILINAATFDKDKAEKRIHILKGLLLAVDKIDETIQLIKKSDNKIIAKKELINFLSIDDIQANAILDMKLSRITKINRQELLSESQEKEQLITQCKKSIEDSKYRDEQLIKQLIDLKNKYGDRRRTQLLNIEQITNKESENGIVSEKVIIILDANGCIKRMSTKSLNKIQGMRLSALTTDEITFFSSKGKVYKILAHKIPEISTPINTLIKLQLTEQIISISSLSDAKAKYCIFITEKGFIKKSKIEEYQNIKRSSSGIMGIRLKEDDTVVNVTFLKEEDLILVTSQGKTIHISTEDINPIGRITAGVRGIKLIGDDKVIAGLPIHKTTDTLALFTEKSYSKRCELIDFPYQGRGGIGINIYNFNKKDDSIICAMLVKDDDKILVTGVSNFIYIKAKQIPILSKGRVGEKLMRSKTIGVMKV